MYRLLLILFVGFSMSACLKGMEPITSITNGSGTPNPTNTYSWLEGSWGPCSATACGTTGTRTRTVVCEDSNSNIVADSFCTTNVGPKPATSQSCSASSCPSASCNLPWGGTIASGSSVTAYAASSVPTGQTCSSQTRTCNNGSLSGSYTHSSCVVESPPPQSGSGIVINLDSVDTGSSRYASFKSYVDSKLNGGNPYAFSAVDAAYMFKITNNSQYCTLAVNLAEEQVATAEGRISSGNRPEIAGDSYLHVGGMLAEVAFAYDWCDSVVTAAQRTRWSNYANQAIYNVWNPNQASWGGHSHPWSGWSIDNPGNNYFYSFTRATMLWGLASNNTTTINLARAKFNMINDYFSDIPGGGSREGTGYGTSHMGLFEIYRTWRDSTGEDIANMNSHLTDSIKYWLHATIPSRGKFAAIGDQARVSEPEVFDYHRILMLYAHHLTNSTASKSTANWWLSHIPVQSMSQGFTRRHDLLTPAANSASAPTEGLVFHATGVGQLFSRTGWGTNDLWLQFGAGRYEESHAHQDQGAFSLANGDYLAINANIWSHSGINQSTDIHNLVRFVNNGSTIPQRAETTSTMVINSQNATTGAVNATANLTPAYRSNPNITSWTRNIDFANRTLTVNDNFTVSSGTQAIFQVNVPSQPSVSGNVITAGGLTVTVLAPSNPTITISNWQNSSMDNFSRGHKIEIRGPAGSGQFQVRLSN